MWYRSRNDIRNYLRCVTATLLRFEQFYHKREIGIAGAKTTRKPVSSALGDPLTVRNYIELAALPGRKNDFNVQLFFDERHETRDLCPVVLSRRAVNDFDFHLFPRLPKRL
jgi:hypothetical protein